MIQAILLFIHDKACPVQWAFWAYQKDTLLSDLLVTLSTVWAELTHGSTRALMHMYDLE
jgi:hypothetical protein